MHREGHARERQVRRQGKPAEMQDLHPRIHYIQQGGEGGGQQQGCSQTAYENERRIRPHHVGKDRGNDADARSRHQKSAQSEGWHQNLKDGEGEQRQDEQPQTDEFKDADRHDSRLGEPGPPYPRTETPDREEASDRGGGERREAPPAGAGMAAMPPLAVM